MICAALYAVLPQSQVRCLAGGKVLSKDMVRELAGSVLQDGGLL